MLIITLRCCFGYIRSNLQVGLCVCFLLPVFSNSKQPVSFKERVSVLLFPPVNNYRRYLIHQTCENYRQQYDLLTFSVGQGPHRRTVVCFRNQLIDPHGFEARKQEQQHQQQQQQQQSVKSWRSNGRSSSASRKRVTELCKMGVKKHISETPLSKSNSVDLYRPPALRHNSSEEPSVGTASNDTVAESTVAASAASATSATSSTTTTAISSTTTSVARKRSPLREPQANAAVGAAATTRRERRPDRAVYVPRARRSQTTPPTTTTTTTTTMPTPMPTSTPAPAPIGALATCNPQPQPQPQPEPQPHSQPLDMPVVNTSPSKTDDNVGQQQPQLAKPKKSRSRRDRGKKTVAKTIDADTVVEIAPSENQPNQTTTSAPPPPDSNCDKETMGGAHRTKTSKTHKQQLQQALRIEDAALPRANNAPTTEDVNKCDNDVRELQRASKEINRSNRRIMKQTFVSDVLEIPEKIESTAPKVSNVAVTSTAPATALATLAPPADSTTEDDDEENEDDWENMFDENGECLNPKILQELTESVGKCKIELPKMDYSLYHIKQSLLNEEEFPHVLEISNFPVEFKTPDLIMLFSQYKSAGFDIKWVDDTHALVVFSSSRIAAEVLTMGHPFVKLKPLAEATLESRLKAKKAGATSLQPYRQRPETCTALARRLVSGALGVKLPTAPEERENEKRVLREAKERKLLAAKQRDEVWES